MSEMDEKLNLGETIKLVTQPAVQEIYTCLEREGFKTRIVGGAIRNALLGEVVVDIDFATEATPKQMMAVFKDAGLKTVPTGVDHGTITVLIKGESFEITTLRQDIETDGRHAHVVFGTDWEADAQRRDFTLNALYCDQRGQIFDPLNGIDDLLQRRVRFIGEAKIRIREDYLRILRFFRLAAQYGLVNHDGPANHDSSVTHDSSVNHAAFELDRSSLLACLELKDGLLTLSMERVQSELLKLIVAPNAPSIIKVMADGQILNELLGPVDGYAFSEMYRLLTDSRFLAVSECDKMPKNKRKVIHTGLLLYALFFSKVEGARTLPDAVKRLKLSNRMRKTIEEIVYLEAMISQDPRRQTLIYLGDGYHGTQLIGALHLLCLNTKDDEIYQDLLDFAYSCSWPEFPITGQDLIKLGAQPGKELGLELDRVKHIWANEMGQMAKADLLSKSKI